MSQKISAPFVAHGVDHGDDLFPVRCKDLRGIQGIAGAGEIKDHDSVPFLFFILCLRVPRCIARDKPSLSVYHRRGRKTRKSPRRAGHGSILEKRRKILLTNMNYYDIILIS